MGKDGLRTYGGGVAIVTGGASGIGRAFSENMAARGCTVVLADRQIELAAEVAAGIEKRGGKATAAELDVTDAAAVDELVRKTAKDNGRLDYMFNNAGIGRGGQAKDYTLDDWRKVVEVNLLGVIHGVHPAYDVMREQGFGHIVNTASMAGLSPTTLIVNYSTTKHAVVGLSTSLRPEAAGYGVRVSVICPGVIRTPIMYGGKYGSAPPGFTPEKIDEAAKLIKPMEPELFAHKVLRKVARNKSIIIEPWYWVPGWWLNRLSPTLAMYLSGKMTAQAYKRMQG